LPDDRNPRREETHLWRVVYFCRIIRGEVPSKKVYEDEHTFAFEDLNPQGPTHVLVIPKKHISGLKEATAGDAELVGRCHLAAAHIARAALD
jgi:histidine triad (HIT) family protein